jgi:hypothetical protein
MRVARFSQRYQVYDFLGSKDTQLCINASGNPHLEEGGREMLHKSGKNYGTTRHILDDHNMELPWPAFTRVVQLQLVTLADI